MGAPNTEQIPQFNQGYLFRQDCRECPKHAWQKLDPYERLGVNIMDAVGAKNAVICGTFGIFIFVIAVFFFRKQIGGVLIDGLTKKKGV